MVPSFEDLEDEGCVRGLRINDMLEAAATAYAQANNGLLPQDPSQIHGYLPEPIDPARVQKFLAKRPPNVTTLEQLKASRK